MSATRTKYLTYAKILLRVQLVSGPGGVVVGAVGARVPGLGEGGQQRHGPLRHGHVAARVVPRGGGRAPHQRQAQEVRQGVAGHTPQSLDQRVKIGFRFDQLQGCARSFPGNMLPEDSRSP